jgi:hypothetical protein
MTTRRWGQVFIVDGVWTTGAVLTNPVDTTVLVDTGVLTIGNYLVAFVGAGSVAWVYDGQHRDAANAVNVQSQRRRPAAGDEDWLFASKISIVAGERLRAVLVGTIVGEVQMSIFFQEVP